MSEQEARETCDRRASLTGIAHYVLGPDSSGEFWVAGHGMRNALWHDRPASYQSGPHAGRIDWTPEIRRLNGARVTIDA